MIDPSPLRPGRDRGAAAFTLVELLVAMAVLSILVVMLAQVVSLTSQAINLNVKKIDATAQARLVFDRLGSDLAARPRRTDLGVFFTKAAGNDSFQFYSQVEGYSGTRHVAAVSYRIQAGTYELERGATGSNWQPDAENPALPFQQTSTPVPLNSGDYEVLARGVFRLEFCYLLKTGVLSTSDGGDFTTVMGVVVAVAALDPNSRQLLTNGQLSTLTDNLKDAVDGSDPISIWNANIAQAGFGSGMPAAAVQNVRLFQRTFYVP